MSVDGIIALVSAGGLGIAAAILIALSTLRLRRPSDLPATKEANPELSEAVARVRADIDKGRRWH
jgi:hypothetical protein